jgi:D-alanyl-lipoteichoic acid acyltransferase DltB (MBOAT superfamily)
MLFNTFQFCVFYLAVVTAFFILPQRWRRVLLLVASYYFYMCWQPKYIVVIIAITLIDYIAGIQIAQATTQRGRKVYLMLSLCSNLGLLFAFKYLDFLGQSARTVLDVFNIASDIPLYHIILPVGISFHTFQAISYTIEVYRGRVPAERNLLTYALYVCFFPQMVAGPIERPYNLLPQFREKKRIEFARVRSGLEMTLWGLFKKVVIADLLALFVNRVYAEPSRFPGLAITVATFFFAIQIYCDFSGYSDMAIGVAKIMGYDLMVNFRQPYLAKSIAEFWHRWHISLSTWFRDYVYFPMGGNRVNLARWCFNVMVVFTLSGLWHGANWTFAVWGALHGTYLVLAKLLMPIRERAAKAVGLTRFQSVWDFERRVCTFCLVLIGWVFFRANSFKDAAYVLTHFYRLGPLGIESLVQVGLSLFQLVMAFGLILLLFVVDYLLAQTPESVKRVWENRWVRWPVYMTCAYSIVFFGVFQRVPFIYFQF